MSRLHIMRHGETEWNIQKRYQGQLDSVLTRSGVSGTLLQKQYIQSLKFNKVFSSPLGRTRSTLELLNPYANEIIFDDRLKEICLGDLQGKTHLELNHLESEAHINFWKNPESFRLTGAETLVDLEERVLDFIEDIKQEKGENLIITHTVIIKMMIKILESRPMNRLWDDPFLHPSTLLILDTESTPTILEVIYPESEMKKTVYYTA